MIDRAEIERDAVALEHGGWVSSASRLRALLAELDAAEAGAAAMREAIKGFLNYHPGWGHVVTDAARTALASDAGAKVLADMNRMRSALEAVMRSTNMDEDAYLIAKAALDGKEPTP